MAVKAEEDLGILLDSKLGATKVPVKQRKLTVLLHGIGKGICSRLGEMILPLHSALVRPHLLGCVQSWAPQYVREETERSEVVQPGGDKFQQVCVCVHFITACK